MVAPVEPNLTQLMTDREEWILTNHQTPDKPFPPLPWGDGRGEVPRGDSGAKENAVELAAARRGTGRRPRM